jgi:hypothetical protein
MRTPLRVWLTEWFAFGNLAFLSVDIYAAHSVNDFARWEEWIPFWFGFTSVLLLPGLIRRRHAEGFPRRAGMAIGAAAIVVGLVGLWLHLAGQFFEQQTLKALVYTAPFAAPLAYAGVGMLLILNRLEADQPERLPAWGAWVVFLAMCGFVGVLALSLLDHAQNGFFDATEWLAVAAAAFTVSFLLPATQYRQRHGYLYVCLLVLLGASVVGIAGFVLHLRADLSGTGESTPENLIFGAPVFAPLLIPNLAILAALGVWQILSTPASYPR